MEISKPSPEQVKAARKAACHTQTQAGATVHSSIRTWQAWEAGTNQMKLDTWELYLIKTGQHPTIKVQSA